MRKILILASVNLLIVVFGYPMFLPLGPGELDTNFSHDGRLIDKLYAFSRDTASSTAVQADGKIVVAGTLNSSRETVGIIRYHCGIARFNPDGTPDNTFDEDGKAQITLGSVFLCSSLAIQADGKIVVGGATSPSGAFTDFALMRVNPDGSVDTSFDGDGKVMTHISGYETVTGLAIQPDGKIIAAGVTIATGSSHEFAAVRYNPNGSLDTSFDLDGKVFTDFAGTIDYANAVTVQQDGKILLAGYTGTNSAKDFAFVRYNPDGSLDLSFDNDGRLAIDASVSQAGDAAQAVAIQPDGKIVAGGYSSGGFTVVRCNADGSLDTSFDGDGRATAPLSGATGFGIASLKIQPDGKILTAGGGSVFALARFNPDGSLDTGFDGDGMTTTSFSITTSRATGVALLSDGRIFAAGYVESPTSFALALYNTNGSLDTTFDGDGKLIFPVGLPVNSAAADVAAQPDGKIVVAGYAFNGWNDDFMVARYNADGSPDASFGTAGKTTTNITASNPFDERAHSIVIQPDGKIIVGGQSNSTNNSTDFVLVRYAQNGTIDTSFGVGGFVTTDFSSNEYLHDLALQPDGKIVAAGYIFLNSRTDFAVARYNSDGLLDNTFDGDGKLTMDIAGSDDRAYAVTIQADGKIVIAGTAAVSNNDFAVARLLADGSFDNTFDGDGKLTTDVVVGMNEGVADIAIQSDGKLLAAGSGGLSLDSDFFLVRYNTTGTLDTSFDGDGKVVTSILTRDIAASVVVQPDGRILVAGDSFTSPQRDASIVRYTPEGALDVSFGAGGIRSFDMGIGESDEILGMTLDSAGRAVVAGSTSSSLGVTNLSLARVLTDFAPRSTLFDFDGDDKADISIFRPSTGDWWYLRSSDGQDRAFGFGSSSDRLVPGDYTGDGKTDIAIWRPATGEWFVLRSEEPSYFSFPFGLSGDVPVPGDYDGDGKTDAAVFRPENSTWYINKSSGGSIIERFGQAGDIPVPADYDGDGRFDIAIRRPSVGQWWLNRSTAGVVALSFGNSTDRPVPGDYTGDGKDDIAFYRPSSGEWFVLRSETLNTYYAFPFGLVGDTPTPGDYDGDRKFDAAVFRPSNTTWYISLSTSGIDIRTFGQTGDIPVPSAFVP